MNLISKILAIFSLPRKTCSCKVPLVRLGQGDYQKDYCCQG